MFSESRTVENVKSERHLMEKVPSAFKNRLDMTIEINLQSYGNTMK